MEKSKIAIDPGLGGNGAMIDGAWLIGGKITGRSGSKSLAQQRKIGLPPERKASAIVR
jgi:hypothetical protein